MNYIGLCVLVDEFVSKRVNETEMSCYIRNLSCLLVYSCTCLLNMFVFGKVIGLI